MCVCVCVCQCESVRELTTQTTHSTSIHVYDQPIRLRTTQPNALAWLTKPYIVRESSIVPIVPIPDAAAAALAGARSFGTMQNHAI